LNFLLVWPRLSLIGQFPLKELQVATLKLINCFGIEILMIKFGIDFSLLLFKAINTDLIAEHF
jgi:hypothetical protein